MNNQDTRGNSTRFTELSFAACQSVFVVSDTTFSAADSFQTKEAQGLSSSLPEFHDSELRDMHNRSAARGLTNYTILI